MYLTALNAARMWFVCGLRLARGMSGSRCAHSETLESLDDANHAYTYTIISSPLPVANYHSTISVSVDPKGSSLKWVGQYDAKGASDADAKKVIDGIYEAGEKSAGRQLNKSPPRFSRCGRRWRAIALRMNGRAQSAP